MNSTQKSETQAEPEVLEALAAAPEYQAESLPQEFRKVSDYTTFFCEYTFKDGDIHFHFFQTVESARFPQTYWKLLFAQILDQVARKHFEADYPRLQASFVEGVLRQGTVLDPEMDQSETSWWLIAQEFENVPDPIALVDLFFEKLDQSLESVIRT
jgi:hypothetical protein